LIGLPRPGSRGREPRSRAVVEVGAALICLPVVVSVSPHQNIRVSIPVYVAGAANAPAVVGSYLVGLPPPIRRGREPRGRAVVEVGAALIRLPVVEYVSPHQNIRVPIPVYVAGAANALAVVGTCLI
jgi:hypothetical protein